MSQGQNNTPLLLFRCLPGFHLGIFFINRRAPWSKSVSTNQLTSALLMIPSLFYDKLYNDLSRLLSCAFSRYCRLFLYEFKALCPPGKESICSTVSKTLSSPYEGIDVFSVSAGKQKEMAGSAPDTMESATPKTCCRHTKSPIYILH